MSGPADYPGLNITERLSERVTPSPISQDEYGASAFVWRTGSDHWELSLSFCTFSDCSGFGLIASKSIDGGNPTSAADSVIYSDFVGNTAVVILQTRNTGIVVTGCHLEGSV
jgi:hypothetical protein